jgi:hypothetical protein
MNRRLSWYLRLFADGRDDTHGIEIPLTVDLGSEPNLVNKPTNIAASSLLGGNHSATRSAI